MTRNMWVHSGSLEGTSCIVMHRVDGLSAVLLLNRNVSGTQDQTNITELNKLFNSVTTWPTTDLFPSVGIPAF